MITINAVDLYQQETKFQVDHRERSWTPGAATRVICYRRRFHPRSLYTRDAAGRFSKWIGGRVLMRMVP